MTRRRRRVRLTRRSSARRNELLVGYRQWLGASGSPAGPPRRVSPAGLVAVGDRRGERGFGRRGAVRSWPGGRGEGWGSGQLGVRGHGWSSRCCRRSAGPGQLVRVAAWRGLGGQGSGQCSAPTPGLLGSLGVADLGQRPTSAMSARAGRCPGLGGEREVATGVGGLAVAGHARGGRRLGQVPGVPVEPPGPARPAWPPRRRPRAADRRPCPGPGPAAALPRPARGLVLL